MTRVRIPRTAEQLELNRLYRRAYARMYAAERNFYMGSGRHDTLMNARAHWTNTLNAADAYDRAVEQAHNQRNGINSAWGMAYANASDEATRLELTRQRDAQSDQVTERLHAAYLECTELAELLAGRVIHRGDRQDTHDLRTISEVLEERGERLVGRPEGGKIVLRPEHVSV